MKKFHFLIISTLLSIIGLSSFKTIKEDVCYTMKYDKEDKESVICDKIYKLSELQEKEKYLQKLINDKSHVALIVTGKPSKKTPYYIIQVGYNSPIRFEVYYNFRINLKYINEKNIEPFV